MISFEDVLNSGIETRAVFDLKRNASVMTNHFNRYNCTLQKLSDGWYRCGFSMYNPTGRISDLNMYFVNDQSEVLICLGAFVFTLEELFKGYEFHINDDLEEWHPFGVEE